MTEKSVSKVSRVINCLIVALLIFAICMILGLNRVRDKLLFFPVSDGYRWECKEINMIFDCQKLESGIKAVYGEVVIDGESYKIVANFLNCSFGKGTIHWGICCGNITKNLMKVKYRFNRGKIIFEIQTDNFNLAPENGILTFVKVPIDSEK